MAANTRSHQANQLPQNQANQPPQTDNTAVSALSTQMTQFGEQMNAQMAQMMEAMEAMQLSFDRMMGALEARYGITPPAPQEAQEEKANLEENAEITAEKQEQEPLYQATVEDDIETTKHGNSMPANKKSTEKDGNSMPNSKSTISIIPRLCTTSFSGDQAARLSIGLFAYQHTLFGSLFDFLPTSFFGSFLASQFGCIRCMEGIEASGQG